MQTENGGKYHIADVASDTKANTASISRNLILYACIKFGDKPNVTKLRKAGSRGNAGPGFFVTIFKKTLDKYSKMCGLFANCG